MAWEVDWEKRKSVLRPGARWQTEYVWARNADSRYRHSRGWHWTPFSTLAKAGVEWVKKVKPKPEWEVDWSKRMSVTRKNGCRSTEKVWARNPSSNDPVQREWGWVWNGVLRRAGVKWVSTRTGRWGGGAHGYVRLSVMMLSEDQRELAVKYGLIRPDRPLSERNISEHRLVASIKYGKNIDGYVVRHLNGIKYDNRPENLVIGTTAENNSDHETARKEAMAWREKYERLLEYATSMGLNPPSEN